MKHTLVPLAVALAVLLPIFPAAGQVPDRLKYFIPAPPAGLQEAASFGWRVAQDARYTVVGAPFDDIGGGDSGVVKVFDSTTGALLFLLTNPGPATPDMSDNFGFAVAISGTRLVVAAYHEDMGSTDSGSAYVYDLSSSTPTVPVVTLHNPSPTLNDQFGYSVAISGTRVVVGTPYDDTGATDAGSVYVYDLSSSTPTVPVATLNNPTPTPYEQFGNSVAISGTRVVVGTPYDDTGAIDAGSVYVYDLSSSTPAVPGVTLNNPSPAQYDYFGVSVAVSGTRVIVGAMFDDADAPDAGSVYVYDLSSEIPTTPVGTLNNPDPTSFDQFGAAVAISGTMAVVGAHGDDAGAPDTGSAYVYDLGSATPAVAVAALNNPSPVQSDFFGYSVAIADTRVVVGAWADDTGAPNAGSAYVYHVSSGTATVLVATLRRR